MLALLILILSQMFLGYLAHEILTIMLFVMIILHIIFCRKMYADIFAAIRKKPSIKQKIKFVTVIILIILLIVQLISGILASAYIFNLPTRNIHTVMLFRVISWIIMGFIALFIALSLKELSVYFANKNNNDDQDGSDHDNNRHSNNF